MQLSQTFLIYCADPYLLYFRYEKKTPPPFYHCFVTTNKKYPGTVSYPLVHPHARSGQKARAQDQLSMVCQNNIKKEMQTHEWTKSSISKSSSCPLGFVVGFGSLCCADPVLWRASGRISQTLWGAAPRRWKTLMPLFSIWVFHSIQSIHLHLYINYTVNNGQRRHTDMQVKLSKLACWQQLVTVSVSRRI